MSQYITQPIYDANFPEKYSEEGCNEMQNMEGGVHYIFIGKREVYSWLQLAGQRP